MYSQLQLSSTGNNKQHTLLNNMLLIDFVSLHPFYRTLPHNQLLYLPVLQIAFDHTVPSYICIKFFLPEINSGLGCVSILAGLMPVPETSVHKYCRVILAKKNIRMTWYGIFSYPIAKSFCKQKLSQVNFRFCVFRANGCHIQAASFPRNDICH